MDIGDTGNSGRLDRGQTAAAPVGDPTRILITDAFAQLSPDNRALLQRAHFYGRTTGQIAAELGVAEASVKTELHHALCALRQTLRAMGVAL